MWDTQAADASAKQLADETIAKAKADELAVTTANELAAKDLLAQFDLDALTKAMKGKLFLSEKELADALEADKNKDALGNKPAKEDEKLRTASLAEAPTSMMGSVPELSAAQAVTPVQTGNFRADTAQDPDAQTRDDLTKTVRSKEISGNDRGDKIAADRVDEMILRNAPIKDIEFAVSKLDLASRNQDQVKNITTRNGTELTITRVNDGDGTPEVMVEKGTGAGTAPERRAAMKEMMVIAAMVDMGANSQLQVPMSTPAQERSPDIGMFLA